MTAADRLAEIQARADKAATLVGALAAGTADWRMRVPVHSDDSDVVLMGTAEDCEKAVAALRAVLDLHKPMRMYEHEDSCEDESEEHREERHVESTESNGEYYCLDLPTGITLCSECSRDLDFDGRDYPCPTVRAVEAALGEVAS